MKIGSVQVDADHDPYFIAEAGVNHNGDFETAVNLIDVASRAGADAVKFQTFSADRLVTREAEKANYQTETTGAGSQYEMLKQYEMDRSTHERLRSHCTERDITFLSTPFDTESADMLADLGVPALKLGSGELDNHPFLEHVADLGLPLLVSTGMGTMEEVYDARDTIRSINPSLDVVFLHCTSTYPCPIDEVNLRAMETMASNLDEPVGYSDHTTHPETPSLAVAAGAHVIEKHFTLDSSLPGPDHEASLEPPELERAVDLVRVASRVRGRSEKKPTASELETVQAVRKALHAATNIPSGTKLEPHHVDIVRPAVGLPPRAYDDVIGARTSRDLSYGDPITDEDVRIDVK